MEKNTPNEGLLDRIAHTLNCSYLSDLRDPALIASICSVISLIAAESYPLREWQKTRLNISLHPQKTFHPAKRPAAI